MILQAVRVPRFNISICFWLALKNSYDSGNKLGLVIEIKPLSHWTLSVQVNPSSHGIEMFPL